MSRWAPLFFFAIVLSATTGLHYFIWARLVRDPGLGPPWRGAATTAIVLLGLLIPGSRLIGWLVPQAATPLAFAAFTWLGLFFFLTVMLFAGDVGRFIYYLATEVGVAAVPDPGRREFLSRAVGGGTLTAALGLGSLSAYFALRPVAVKRVRVPIADLPPELDGLTVAQLTDVHVGSTIGKPFIDDVVRKVNALDVDIIAITGDLVDGSVPQLSPAVAPLGTMRSRHGTYFVTGNHEYYSGERAWLTYLRSIGIRTLENQRVGIVRNGVPFDIVGINDPTGSDQMEALAEALAGADPTTKRLLLAHQPKAITAAAPHGITLQISGHTHGGQIFPFRYFVYLQQPYVSGLHDHEGTKLYVSQGTGYWGPPMRLLSPAEITHLTLVRA